MSWRASLAKDVSAFANADGGFLIIGLIKDLAERFTRIKGQLADFVWRPPQLVGEIDTMKPALVYDVARGAPR